MPSDYPSQEEIGISQAARALIGQGRYRDAVQILEDGLSKFPRNLVLGSQLIKAYGPDAARGFAVLDQFAKTGVRPDLVIFTT